MACLDSKQEEVHSRNAHVRCMLEPSVSVHLKPSLLELFEHCEVVADLF